MSRYIYHIATGKDFFAENEFYTHASLESEGFIHFSTYKQVLTVANLFFKEQKNLLLLKVDVAALGEDLKWDYVEEMQQEFPHLYAKMPLKAVVKWQSLALNNQGEFEFPLEMMTVEQAIEHFQLEPLAKEGGFFRQTYKSAMYFHDRSLSTSIYYLMTADSFSQMHRLRHDEIWHFLAGDPVEMLQLTAEGIAQKFQLREEKEVLVPAKVWQGARLAVGGDWALVSCIVSPGFEFEDFEMLEKEKMLEMFSEHRDKILDYYA